MRLHANLLSQGASELLSALEILPSSFGEHDPLRLTVSLELQGFLSGSGARVTTGTIRFPIEVIRSQSASTTSCGWNVDPRASAFFVEHCCLYVGQTAETTYQCCTDQQACQFR